MECFHPLILQSLGVSSAEVGFSISGLIPKSFNLLVALYAFLGKVLHFKLTQIIRSNC